MRNLKKLMIILWAAVMILGAATLLPDATAHAETVYLSYVNATGDAMAAQKCEKVNNYDTAWSDGWYAVVTNNTVIVNTVTVTGTVNLILPDGAKLTVWKGIDLRPGSHLIIWGGNSGKGQLIAEGDNYHAGIGGGSEAQTGSLTINGGTITAEGGKAAPGLGSYSGDSGIITINGGTVTAKGSITYVDADGAPGIGSGSGAMNHIYFYGGTTKATGGAKDNNGHYFPPIGSGPNAVNSGSIHLSTGMVMQGASLDDNGGLASGYSSTVTVKPNGNKRYTINTDFDPELGTVTTSLPIAMAGEEITVTATPETGYELTGLTVTDHSGAPVDVTADGKFTMPSSSVVIHAEFQKINYTVTVNYSGYGTAAADKTTANYNDTITLTLTPDGLPCDPTTFTVVDGAGNNIAVTNNQFSMPASNVTVTVEYGTALFSITKGEITGPGTVTVPETANVNSEVTLTVTPDAGCHLTSLTVTDSTGQTIRISDQYTFTMPASAVTVTAAFETSVQELRAYQIQPEGYGYYTVSVNGNDPTDVRGADPVEFPGVRTGDEITVTFYPTKSGRVYKFYLEDAASFEHHYESSIQSNAYSFSMPPEETLIVAEFAEHLTIESVDYIDEDSVEHTVEAIVLTGEEPTDLYEQRYRVQLGQDGKTTWYVVKNNLTYTSGEGVYFPTFIFLRGQVNLILADGKTLSVQEKIAGSDGSSLSVYGQTAGTGKLLPNSSVADLNVCSAVYEVREMKSRVKVKNGVLTVNGNVDSAVIEISGGVTNVTGNVSCSEIKISGGVTNITGTVFAEGAITLGCGDKDDRITAGGYSPGVDCTMKIAEGQTLIDDEREYSGVLKAEDQAMPTNLISQMAGKTLMRKHTHDKAQMTHVSAVIPTYDSDTKTYTDGIAEHYVCETCGELLVEQDGVLVPTTREELIVPYFRFRTTNTGGYTLCTVLKYNGADADVVIPDKVPDNYYDENQRGNIVTGIDSKAFMGNTVIVNVTTGDALRGIYESAFEGCTSLKTVTVGNSLDSISKDAFKGCTSLECFTSTSKGSITCLCGGATANPEGPEYSFEPNTSVVFRGPHGSGLLPIANDYLYSSFSPTDRHTEPTWTWAEDYSSATALFNCDGTCELNGDNNALFTDNNPIRQGNVTDYFARVTVDGKIYKTGVEPAHTHAFTFSAEGAVITATCSAEDCYLPERKATLTLSATDAAYSGSAYTGASLSDTTAWTEAGLTVPTIEYAGRGNTSYTKSATAPIDAGTYTASITVDTDKTATADFTISPMALTITGATATDRAYDKDSTAVTISAVTFRDSSEQTVALTPGEDKDYTITGAMTDADAGDGKDVTVTVTLKNTNYSLATNTTTTTVNISKAAAQTIADVTDTIVYTAASVSKSVAGKMPSDAGTLRYSAGTASKTGSVTVSGFDVDNSGTVTAALSGGAVGDTVTLPVTIGSTNYADSMVNVVITLTVKDAEVSITGAPTSAKTYGDADFTLTGNVTDAGTGTGTWTWNTSDAAVFHIKSKGANATVQILKAGSATITAGYESDTTVGTQTTAVITVNPKTVTIAAKDQNIYVGGTVPGLQGIDFYTVTGLVGEDALTTAPTLAYQKDSGAATPDNTRAGTYDIVPSGASAGNNYTISYVNGTLTISDKGTQTIAADNVTATYGDTDKSVSASVTDPAKGGGAISYAVKDGSGDYIGVDATTGELTIKKVPADGKAYVVVTAAETADHAQATKEVIVTINKAVPAVSAPEGLSASYGQKLTDVSLEAFPGWSWEDGTSDVGEPGANVFIATYTPNDTDNYLVVNAALSVTVLKGSNPATVTSPVSVKRGGKTVNLSEKITLNGAEGAVTYSVPEGADCTLSEDGVFTSGNTVDEISVTVNVAEDDYYLASENLTIVVNVTEKDAQELAFESEAVEKTYGDEPFTLAVSGVKTAVAYSVVEGNDIAEIDEATGKVTIKKAGSAMVLAIAEEDDEYEEGEASYILTVNPADLIITAKDQECEYNGELQGSGDTRFENSEEIAQLITVQGLKGSDAVTAITVFWQGKEVGKYPVEPSEAAIGDATENYNISYEEGTFWVKKPAISVTVSGDTGTVIYNGKEQSYEGTVTAVSADETFDASKFSYTGSRTVTGMNAGQYSTELTEEGCAYQDELQKINWTIGNPVKLTIQQKSMTGATVTLDRTQLTWNGAQQTVSVTGVTIDGLKLTADDYDVTGNQGMDIGSYQVTVTGKGNYAGTAAADWSILARSITASAADVTAVYDGQPHGITVTVTEPADGAVIRYGKTEGTYDLETSPTITDAAESPLTVYYRITAKGYEPATGKAAVTVTRADLSVTAPKPVENLVYTGSALRLITAGSVGNNAGTMVYAVQNGENNPQAEEYHTEIPTAIDAGTYDVWYKAVSDENHNAAIPGKITVAIGTRAVTITADSDTKTYDGTPLTKNSWKVSGLAEGDTLGSVTMTGSRTEAGSSDNVPSAAKIVNAAGKDVTGNYEITYTEGTLSVTPRPAAITAEAKSKVYGEADPELTATVSGTVGDEKLNYTLARAKGEDAGEYAITVTVGENPNYEVTPAGAVFTVKKAKATVTAEAKSKVYGEEDPELTATVSGTVGDGKLNYTLARAKGEDAGEYAITVTVGENPNYEVEAAGSSLTIAKADSAVSTAPTAKTGLVEDGTAQELVTAGTADGGEMQYVAGMDDRTALTEDWSNKVPTGTDAGTYYVWYKVAGDANHNDTEAACVKAEIEKAPEPEPEPEPVDLIEQFVARCYLLILDREPEAGGLAYWTKQLKTGESSVSEMLQSFVSSKEFRERNFSDKETLEILLNTMNANPEDWAKWTAELEKGTPLLTIINGLGASNEFKQVREDHDIDSDYGNEYGKRININKVRAMVARYYRVFLGREAEDAGMNYWAELLSSGKRTAVNTILGFLTSKEYTALKKSNGEIVEALYQTMLNRAAEAEGKAAWTAMLDKGEPVEKVINGIAESNEFKAICKNLGIRAGKLWVAGEEQPAGDEGENPEQKDPEDKAPEEKWDEDKIQAFVARCYRKGLGRDPETEGLEGWTDRIVRGKSTPVKAVKAILTSEEAKAKGLSDEAFINALYGIFLNRSADEAGMNGWVTKLEEGTTRESLISSFAKTEEVQKAMEKMKIKE